MLKPFLFFTFLFLSLPSICRADPSFQEGQKVWKDYSAAEYDVSLNAAAVGFPDRFQVSKNRGVDLGPVAIRLDGFRGGSHPYIDYWVRVNSLPNIQLDRQISVAVIIDHVWDTEKNDHYSPKEKTRQSMQNIEGDEALTFISKLHLKRGSDVSEIQEISGTVVFSLPLKLGWMTFDKTGVGKEESVPAIGSKAHLSHLRFDGESSWVQIRFEGSEASYLTALAYNKTGKQLKKKGFAKNSVSGGWLYAYSFEGELEKLQVLVSTQTIKREYPFTINLEPR